MTDRRGSIADRRNQPLDEVQRAAHYNKHPSGVETIEVIEHLSGNLALAFKYVWRRYDKGTPVKDLRKAAWYFRREQARLHDFDDASMWDGNYWIAPARKVADTPGDEVLTAVLLELLAVPVGVKDSGACRRMAELCDYAATILVICPKCGGEGKTPSIHDQGFTPPCDECRGTGKIQSP